MIGALLSLPGFVAVGLIVRAKVAPPRERAAATLARRELLTAIARRPGVTLAELRHDVPLGWGTLYHHIAHLENEGLVRTLVAGRRRIVLPAGVEEPEEASVARALLRGATAERVARFVADHPGTRVADVAAGVGESERVAYYHLRQLLDAGLVVSSSSMRRFGLRASPLLERLLGAPSAHALEAAPAPVPGP